MFMLFKGPLSLQQHIEDISILTNEAVSGAVPHTVLWLEFDLNGQRISRVNGVLMACLVSRDERVLHRQCRGLPGGFNWSLFDN
jgi:hypothetical protein